MGYLFEPEVLHEVARVGLDRETVPEKLAAVTEELARRYPGRICTQPDWILNTANGAMGELTLLYGSVTEYVILFGTPIGTEGHSGRYHADVYDYMIDGEMWTYYEGDLERTISRPGDGALLARGRAKGYCVKEQAWMLEYARGWIPTMLGPGLADNFFSNLDFRSVQKLLVNFGALTVKELLRGKI